MMALHAPRMFKLGEWRCGHWVYHIVFHNLGMVFSGAKRIILSSCGPKDWRPHIFVCVGKKKMMFPAFFAPFKWQLWAFLSYPPTKKRTNPSSCGLPVEFGTPKSDSSFWASFCNSCQSLKASVFFWQGACSCGLKDFLSNSRFAPSVNPGQ